MRYGKFVPLVFFLAYPPLGMAGRFHYLPYIAPPPWETSLIVTNPAAADTSIHVRFLSGKETAATEKTYTVAGHSTLKLSLAKEFPSAVSAILESDGFSPGLRVEYLHEGVCGFSLSDIASQNLTVSIPEQPWRWSGVAVSNLGDLADTVTLAAFGATGTRLGTVEREVPGYGSAALLVGDLFSVPEQVRTIQVRGKNRLTVLSITQLEDSSLIAFPADPGLPVVLEPDQGMTYFLVGNPHFGVRTDETYVLALSDPEQVLQARAIVRDPGRPRIVVGSIARGHANFNRNLTEHGSPAYSWHIDRFHGFADVAAEVCDGGPVNVDIELPYWLEKVGRVCFWGQTVVREVSLEAIQSGTIDEKQ